MLSERTKSGYINMIIGKVRRSIAGYEADAGKLDNLNRLFSRISESKDKTKDFYILSHIRELSPMGKYLLYISKKLDDNTITFDTLSQNVAADSEFIKKASLKYLGEPAGRSLPEYSETAAGIAGENHYQAGRKVTAEIPAADEDADEYHEEPSADRTFMKLIKAESTDHEEEALELPEIGDSAGTGEEAFELPDENEYEEKESANVDEKEAVPLKARRKLSFGFDEDESSFITGEKARDETTAPEADHEREGEGSLNGAEAAEEFDENEMRAGDKIVLTDEIDREIREYAESGEEEEQETEEDEIPENEEFTEYENLVNGMNSALDEDLASFNESSGHKAEERSIAIERIIATAEQLEERSLEMSFEVITNIYQTIRLSFERISEGKYDISDGTVSLLRQGLGLVASLIRGDDYFLYKGVLKSLENIRKNLIEEKKKKEEYLERKRSKEEIQRQLNDRYPFAEQRKTVNATLQSIRSIESAFRSAEDTSGDFHAYDSIKALSGSLNSFRNIAQHAKELELPDLARMSEASFNFVKYICNYKKDPADQTNKEALNYIVHSLKSLLIGREVEELELFMTYLNDPMKLYTITKDHQNNKLRNE